MALQQTINCKNGVIIENAYIKITNLLCDNVSKKVNINIGIFKDSSYANQNICVDSDIKYFNADMSVNSVNLLKQGYDYLKTQPDYVDAVDC